MADDVLCLLTLIVKNPHPVAATTPMNRDRAAGKAASGKRRLLMGAFLPLEGVVVEEEEQTSVHSIAA